MVETLNPSLYHHEFQKSLPAYLSYTKEGICVEKSEVEEGDPGPYHFLADYGKSLEWLQQPTSVFIRPWGVRVRSERDDQARESFANLTHLANAGFDLDSKEYATLYTANFALGFAPTLREAVDSFGYGMMDWTLISPLRGGEVVQVIAKACGYFPEIPKIRASRVVLENGNYLVGIRELEPRITIRRFVVFGDDCRAAAGSEDTLLHWAIGKNPDLTDVRAVVGVGVKSSSEVMVGTWRKQFDYSSFMGAEANGMNNHYYLTVTDEEKKCGRFPSHCEMRVGDMGRAMDLGSEERKEVLVPLIEAVVQGKIDGKRILEATRFAISSHDLVGAAQKLQGAIKKKADFF